MIVTGSGKEAVMTHNTDNSYVGITHRASIGSGVGLKTLYLLKIVQECLSRYDMEQIRCWWSKQ